MLNRKGTLIIIRTKKYTNQKINMDKKRFTTVSRQGLDCHLKGWHKVCTKFRTVVEVLESGRRRRDGGWTQCGQRVDSV